MEVNEILLRRRYAVILEEGHAAEPRKDMVAAMMKNIEALGFTFSREVVEILLTLNKEVLEAFYMALVPELKKLVGADKVYSPMYPNFPQQVLEASEAELFFNAIFHYWTWGQWKPEYEKAERFPLYEDVELTSITLGTREQLMEIFTNLVGSKTSLSAQDKGDMEWFVKECPDYGQYLPEEVPLKENCAFLGKLILEESPVKDASCIQKYFKTATDVLRLVTAVSGGDISLAVKTRFRKMKRAERRLIMDLLAGCSNLEEDMYRYQKRWIRVAEILHPSEYKAAKYAEVCKAFDQIRNEKGRMSFTGKVNQSLEKWDLMAAVELLKKRPGELARRLDELLRLELDEGEFLKEYPDELPKMKQDGENIGKETRRAKNAVLEAFAETAEQVATPVLLQVRQHFLKRGGEDFQKENPLRVFMPKGNLARVYGMKNQLPEIAPEYCQRVVEICENALVKQYSQRESMGKVFVDEEFRTLIAPFSQRSASTAAKTLVRGSRIPLGESAKIFRGFIWWTNIEVESGCDEGCEDESWIWELMYRVDLDLSVVFFGEDWKELEHVSYTNLRSSDFFAVHSGDIVDGGPPDGEGAAEFLDFDMEQAAKKGIRYAAFQVYSYVGRDLKEIPCRFGWMKRQSPDSGEIFEPSTVEQSLELTAESCIAIPLVVDCVKKEIIWCDLAMTKSGTYANIGGINLESNLYGVTASAYALLHLNKTSLYDLIRLNAMARGELVSSREEADIIFSNDRTKPVEMVEMTGEDGVMTVVEQEKDVTIVTAYEADYYMGQML